jgi:predicted transcriptional regulator
MRTPLVEDHMTREVLAVAPETSLATLARVLELHDVSGVPVVDEHARPIGVVTMTDVFNSEKPRSAAIGPSVYYRLWHGDVIAVGNVDGAHRAIEGIVADVMARFVLSIGRGSSIEDAARLMVAERVHRVLVIDDRSRILGVVTPSDCLRALFPARSDSVAANAR